MDLYRQKTAPERRPDFGRAAQGRSTVGPLSLVLCLVALLGGLFYLLHARGYDDQLAALPRDSEAAMGEVSDRFDAAVDHLLLLSEDLGNGTMDRTRFESLASAFTKNHHEVLSIAWISQDDFLRWVVPRETETAMVDVKIAERDEEATLARAKAARKPAFSEPYVSVGGQRLLSVFVPVAAHSGKSVGAFRCLFSADAILQYAVPQWLTTLYEVDLVDAKGIVFAKRSDGRKTDANLVSTKSLPQSWPGVGLKLQRYAEGVDWEVVLFGALIVGLATGVALAVVELSRDNKRRLRLAQEMEAAKNLAEQASQAKTEFLANISHEIRTPIGAIIGYAEMQESPGSNADNWRTAAVAIKRNGQHLLHLINDLLDVSKVEAGLLEIEPADISLGHLVRETFSVCQPLAAAKGLALQLNAPGLLPRTIRTDPLRLKQILVNVIGNAVKFTEHGAVIVHVRFHLEHASQPVLSMAVEDTGIGMSAAQKPRLFHTFVQADSSIARRYGGTGLGLSLSKRLAVLLGGDLVLERSEPEKGSVFLVTIDPGPLDGSALGKGLDFSAEDATHAAAVTAGPKQPLSGVVFEAERLAARSVRRGASGVNRHKEPSGPVGLGPRLAGRRFLLVEDSLDNQIIFAEFLEHEGAEVLSARDGLDGIAVFEREFQARGAAAFDAIVMDVQMPGIDGYQATAEIRRRGYVGPVLALTAHAMRGERERSLAAGCDDYLPKPVARGVLTATLERLSGASHVSEPLLSDLVHDPRVLRVLPGFIKRLPVRMIAFRNAFAGKSWQSLASHAHQLRGTAGNYGYPSISAAAARVEESALELLALNRGDLSADQAAHVIEITLAELGDLIRRAVSSYEEQSAGRGAQEEQLS